MSKNKVILIRAIITFVFAAILYYIFLPPFNLTAIDFWMYLVFVVGMFYLTSFLNIFNTTKIFGNINLNKITKLGIIPIGIASVFILIMILNFCLSPLFRANAYSKRVTIDESNEFVKDVAPVNFNALPLLDKDSSQKLGDRVMGQMPELVSQFFVSDLYTQINYNDEIVRVTPLEYDGFIKYFTNRKDGVKGYITVNSVSGESKLTKLKKGMKYMPSAMFNENLSRKLRFSYPTEIFGEPNFEIDNDGNPYWIVPTIKYEGVGIKRDVSGIVILDPITGKSKKYSVDKVPKWVDHVYSADLIIEQVDDWGQYKNGFFNSIFGQKNVVKTTTGYNYTVMNDDVYLYTGITSAAADASNLGFILTNMRTKETHFYAVPGAEEYSAMDSAEGQVQQMKYKASFPLLINLNNKPTYLVSLKDNAGLVKMYAFVDVTDYQKVVVTDSSKGIEAAAKNYLGDADINIDSSKHTSKKITISSIKNAMIDGNTYYYIKDTEGKKYRVSIKVDKINIPFLEVNQTIEIQYSNETDVTEIKDIK